MSSRAAPRSGRHFTIIHHHLASAHLSFIWGRLPLLTLVVEPLCRWHPPHLRTITFPILCPCHYSVLCPCFPPRDDLSGGKLWAFGPAQYLPSLRGRTPLFPGSNIPLLLGELANRLSCLHGVQVFCVARALALVRGATLGRQLHIQGVRPPLEKKRVECPLLKGYVRNPREINRVRVAE